MRSGRSASCTDPLTLPRVALCFVGTHEPRLCGCPQVAGEGQSRPSRTAFSTGAPAPAAATRVRVDPPRALHGGGGRRRSIRPRRGPGGRRTRRLVKILLRFFITWLIHRWGQPMGGAHSAPRRWRFQPTPFAACRPVESGARPVPWPPHVHGGGLQFTQLSSKYPHQTR